MASEPQFLPPSSPEPAPLSPVPAEHPATPRRRMGTLAIVVISAVVGALVGAGATILLAPHLLKLTPSGNTVVAALAPISHNRTEDSAALNVADQDAKA